MTNPVASQPTALRAIPELPLGMARVHRRKARRTSAKAPWQFKQTKKKSPPKRALGKKSRQRPTLPHGFPCSTIGSEELNFRVREGIGCGLLEITTGNLL